MRRDGRLLHGWAGATRSRTPSSTTTRSWPRALLDLYEATGDRRHLERARELVEALEARFHDDGGGGYFFTAHDGEPLIARTKSGADGSLPVRQRGRGRSRSCACTI